MIKEKLTGIWEDWGKGELGRTACVSEQMLTPDRAPVDTPETEVQGRLHLGRGSRTRGQGPARPRTTESQGAEQTPASGHGYLPPEAGGLPAGCCPWSWALAVPPHPGPVEIKVVPTPRILC